MKKIKCIVTWVDAETPDTNWLYTEEANTEAEKPLDVCTSIGFLFYDGDDHITLCHTDGVDQFKLAIKIPKKWIISIQEI